MRKPLEMNEPATTVVALPLEINRLRGKPDACMEEAVKWAQKFRDDMVSAKLSAAVAGEFFRQAKLACRRGDWDDTCAAHSIPVTTANRHIAFAEHCIEQGKLAIPGLDDDTRALRVGIEQVMGSPKPWTSLLRYTGLLAKQGQYDPERYQSNKDAVEAAGGQTEFGFVKAIDHLRRVRGVAAPSVYRLVALRAELQTTIEWVEQQIQHINGTVDV